MKNVTIYSTPSRHFCHATKEFFKEHSIVFNDYNVSEDSAKRDEMIQKSGQMSVPIIFVDNEMVTGFDEPKLRKLLEIE